MKKDQDFEKFQRYFKGYQKQFGLTGYKVYFKHEPLENTFADIDINLADMVATVRLNSKLPAINIPHKDIRLSAKHEALHLLIGRVEQNGRRRFLTSAELYESAEEVVNKLEELV